jgi:glycosyltransferase involved in cell wall biosynthesis
VRRHVVKIAPTGFFADYGCHVRILEEARALQDHGYDVTVVTYPGGQNPAGLPVVRIPSWLHRGAPRVGSHWRKLLLDPALLATALTGLPPRGVDILHAHLHEGVLIGWPLARMHGAGLVFDYQGSLTREMLDHQFIRPANPLLHVFSWLERLANRLPHRILTSSENARNSLIAESGLPTDRVVAVTDGVDLARFRPRQPDDAAQIENLRGRLGIPPNRLIVGYLGLLAPYQGTDDLIHAAKLVIQQDPGAQFLIMGFPNEDAHRHAAHATGLADHMHFTGRIPYADAPEMLRVLDIAVAPKRSESEGNGKVLNYMAAGLPVVAYDGPVARELLGSSGLRVPVSSVDGLAQALLRYLADPDLRTRHGQTLRRRVERLYGWDRQIQHVIRVYDSLCEPSSPSPWQRQQLSGPSSSSDQGQS